MSRCYQRKGILGYCKKDEMHPGDHDNGKERWPRTGSEQKRYQEYVEFMADLELETKAAADAFRAEKDRLMESDARREREQQQRRQADTGQPQRSEDNRAGTDFVRREMERMLGPRGPACLLAVIPDPGIAGSDRIAWIAVPSWEQDQVTAAKVDADAPPGWHARAAAWDAAMPNYMWIHVRDLFASGRCGEGGVAADGSYAQVGVAIGGDWSEWYLECPRPAVPDISDHRIWETS